MFLFFPNYNGSYVPIFLDRSLSETELFSSSVDSRINILRLNVIFTSFTSRESYISKLIKHTARSQRRLSVSVDSFDKLYGCFRETYYNKRYCYTWRLYLAIDSLWDYLFIDLFISQAATWINIWELFGELNVKWKVNIPGLAFNNYAYQNLKLTSIFTYFVFIKRQWKCIVTFM